MSLVLGGSPPADSLHAILLGPPAALCVIVVYESEQRRPEPGRLTGAGRGVRSLSYCELAYVREQSTPA
jgi:hypothetical protein